MTGVLGGKVVGRRGGQCRRVAKSLYSTEETPGGRVGQVEGDGGQESSSSESVGAAESASRATQRSL